MMFEKFALAMTVMFLCTFIQAANGIIIFGWTTALIIYYLQKLFGPEQRPGEFLNV